MSQQKKRKVVLLRRGVNVARERPRSDTDQKTSCREVSKVIDRQGGVLLPRRRWCTSRVSKVRDRSRVSTTRVSASERASAVPKSSSAAASPLSLGQILRKGVPVEVSSKTSTQLREVASAKKRLLIATASKKLPL